MTDFLIGLVLWILGGYVGARIAAFFNKGNKLKFWGQLAAGVLGGVILGLILDNAPLLQPVMNFFHSGNIEDAIAGVLGGLAFGTLGAIFAPKTAKEAPKENEKPPT
jgi:hypothetical protein